MGINHQTDLFYFQIGYKMEYLRICHELYRQENAQSDIYSYLEERIAEEVEFLDFIGNKFHQQIENHLLKDLLYLSKLREGMRE